MTTCTWHSTTGPCTAKATHPYHDPAGRLWANLCGIHSLTLDTALASPNPRLLLSAWVRASGGAEKLADSMKSERDPAARVLSEWNRATKELTGEDL